MVESWWEEGSYSKAATRLRIILKEADWRTGRILKTTHLHPSPVWPAGSLVISVSDAWWLVAQSNKDRLGKKKERICRKELGGS